MQENLLTIAIATYNRHDYLKENLDVLLPQCKKYTNVVKVVISDNASADNTGELISGYQSEYPGLITYNRNKENLGLQGNFSKAVELSHSKYIYLMGDDDILSPNFLEIVIPYLTSDEEYGIVHWGRLVGDADCNNNKIQDPYFDVIVRKYEVGDFIKRTLSSTNFLSSCLFNKRCWELGEECEDKEMPGYGYYARFMWGAIKLELPCIYYYLPLVMMRNPRRVWAKNAPIYFFCEMYDIFKHLDNFIPGVYNKWIDRTNDNYFYNKPSYILGFHNNPKYYQPWADSVKKVLSRKEKILFKFSMKKVLPIFDKFYWHYLSLLSRVI